MTETGIVALAGVVATLLSGLGAAWLTNRSARQRDLDQRSSLFESEIRALIVTIIVAAREWGGATAGIGAGLAVATTKSQFQKLLVDLLNSSKTGDDFTRSGSELHTGLTEAQLRLQDGPLADVIDAMTQLMLRWWEEVVTPISEDLTNVNPSLQRRMDMSTRHSRHWVTMIRNLETTARLELPKL